MAAAADRDKVGRIVGPTERSREDVVCVLGRAVTAHAGLAAHQLGREALPIGIPIGHAIDANSVAGPIGANERTRQAGWRSAWRAAACWRKFSC